MSNRYYETQHERHCAYVTSDLPAPCTCIAGRLASNPFIGKGELESAWVSGYRNEPLPGSPTQGWLAAFNAGRDQEEADRAKDIAASGGLN